MFFYMPRKTRLGRRLFVVLAALLVGLLGFAVPAFASTSPEISVTVGSTSVTVGQTVTVTVQFTNTQATDVDFIYQSLSPDWTTSNETGIDYAFQSCRPALTGWCNPTTQNVAWYDNPPIAPNATQTVTLTYEVLADSACGSDTISFNFYDYDEYNSDTEQTKAPCSAHRPRPR